MEERGRIKTSSDRTDMCKYVLGDLVSVDFVKYGRHCFIGVVEEISYNCHGLEGIWISVLPTKEFNSDEVAKRMIKEKIRCIVPLRCIKQIHDLKM